MTEPDAGVARSAALDLLTCGFDELLWTIENECVWAQIRTPRQWARLALTELAAQGHLEFFRWAGDTAPAEPIPLEAGLALLATEVAWELGDQAVTVALSREGYDSYLGVALGPLPHEDRMSPVTPARRAIQLAGQSIRAHDRGDERTATHLRELAADLLHKAEMRFEHSTWRDSFPDAGGFRPVLERSRTLIERLADSDTPDIGSRVELDAAAAAMAAWDRDTERATGHG